MLPPGDLLVVAAIALASSAGVGLVTLLVLRAVRSRPLGVQLAVVLAGAVVGTAAGMAAVARAMYLSPHDLQVGLWVAAASGAASLLVALVLARRLARSSRALSALARSLGDDVPGGSGVPAATGQTERGASGELAVLARELAEAGRRLADARERERQLEASRRQLVAWISHDLRTPLAGIRAVAEALEDGMVDDPARYHQRMRRQADELARLVDDLFELSSLDAGTLRLSYEEVSLIDVVSDAVADLRPVAGQRGVVVQSDLDRDVVVRLDPRLISRAIGNLVTNALEHAPAATPVVVRAHLDRGRPVVSVLDDGPGIAAGAAGHLGGPGAASGSGSGSGSSSVSRGPGGRGLGLAIVSGIVAAHDGELAVASTSPGTRVDLVLPEAAVLGP